MPFPEGIPLSLKKKRYQGKVLLHLMTTGKMMNEVPAFFTSVTTVFTPLFRDFPTEVIKSILYAESLSVLDKRDLAYFDCISEHRRNNSSKRILMLINLLKMESYLVKRNFVQKLVIKFFSNFSN